MSGSKLRVAIICGGRSAEHEISLLSARFVLESLDREKYEPVLVGIDKTGRWLLQDEAWLLGSTPDPKLMRLNEAAPSASLTKANAGRQEPVLLHGGESRRIDVVFPVMHGPNGEDGAVQGLLEIAGVPYVGAGVLGSAVGLDKDVQKRLLAAAGIPVVEHITLRQHRYRLHRSEELQRAEHLGYPVFVKPANLGSSVGVSRANSRAELESAIDEAFRYDTKILIERAVESPREIECAVLGNDEPIASVLGEVAVGHGDGFYSYAAKYLDEHGAALYIPANLPPGVTERAQELALRAFTCLECAGMARVDFLLSRDGDLYLNEINTIPGFTSVSMYPRLWAASGLSAQELMDRLIALAFERFEVRLALSTTV